MERFPNVQNIRNSYENNYSKTYEGSTWRGAQENGNANIDRYGQKQPAPRFQGNNQFNGHPAHNAHQTEVVQNGVDGKPVRQPRPNNYQNRQNGAYVPRQNTNGVNNNAAATGAHQGQYVPNPNTNGYQGNRGKPEVSATKSTLNANSNYCLINAGILSKPQSK